MSEELEIKMTFRLDASTAKDVEALAKQERRTISAMVRLLVEEAIMARAHDKIDTTVLKGPPTTSHILCGFRKRS